MALAVVLAVKPDRQAILLKPWQLPQNEPMNRSADWLQQARADLDR